MEKDRQIRISSKVCRFWKGIGIGMEKRRRHKAGILAAVLCLAMVSGGCGSASEAETVTEEEASIAVSLQEAATGTITLSNSFVGTISPEETVMVMPLAAGIVTETFFEVGDTVNAGDVLFKIDDEAARLQLEQAELSAASAQLQADSALTTQQDSTDLQLESSKLQAKSGYEQAQIGYFQAKSAYERLEKNLDNANSMLAAAKAKAAAAAQAPSASGNDASADEEKNAEALQKDIATWQSTVSELESAKSQAEAAYLQARSAYSIAERSKEITEQTAELTQGAVVEDTEASLAAQVDLANLGIETAEMALSHYTVTAPVSGMIESKNVEVNGMAAQGNPAYTIVNNNTMTVTFQVSEAVMNTLSIGQPIVLDRNNVVYEAAITEIGSSVNPQTGLFQIKACAEASGTELPSGVSVKITADTYQAKDALLIPYDAVYYENEGAYVYIEVNGRAVKTPITTGIFNDENIEVTGGLNPGDMVVTSWSPQLTDGVLLNAIRSEAAGQEKSEE